MNQRRRLLGYLAALPALARAQPTARHIRIGILAAGFGSKSADHPNFPVLFAAMRKRGYVEGSAIRLESPLPGDMRCFCNTAFDNVSA